MQAVIFHLKYWRSVPLLWRSPKHVLIYQKNQTTFFLYMAWRAFELLSFSNDCLVKLVHKMSKQIHIKWFQWVSSYRTKHSEVRQPNSGYFNITSVFQQIYDNVHLDYNLIQHHIATLSSLESQTHKFSKETNSSSPFCSVKLMTGSNFLRSLDERIGQGATLYIYAWVTNTSKFLKWDFVSIWWIGSLYSRNWHFSVSFIQYCDCFPFPCIQPVISKPWNE